MILFARLNAHTTAVRIATAMGNSSRANLFTSAQLQILRTISGQQLLDALAKTGIDERTVVVWAFWRADLINTGRLTASHFA